MLSPLFYRMEQAQSLNPSTLQGHFVGDGSGVGISEWLDGLKCTDLEDGFGPNQERTGSL